MNRFVLDVIKGRVSRYREDSVKLEVALKSEIPCLLVFVLLGAGGYFYWHIGPATASAVISIISIVISFLMAALIAIHGQLQRTAESTKAAKQAVLEFVIDEDNIHEKEGIESRYSLMLSRFRTSESLFQHAIFTILAAVIMLPFLICLAAQSSNKTIGVFEPSTLVSICTGITCAFMWLFSYSFMIVVNNIYYLLKNDFDNTAASITELEAKNAEPNE